MSAAVDASFWAGRRVLVTGHTGFKGSWLCLWLVALGADVTGFSIGVPTTPSLYALTDLAASVRDLRGDVGDADAVLKAVQEARPDVVLHLAAQSLVRPSFASPVETYQTNVMGTVHVLDAVRQSADVGAALIVTSDKCYENREWRWGYREYEPKGGYDPYSSSKGCAELVTDAYTRSYFGVDGRPRVASARAGNVIGGGDWSGERLVVDVMTAALNGTEVALRAPAAVRPWQHVLDCLSGYLVLTQALWGDRSMQGGWNFGPDSADVRTVEDLVAELGATWPGGIPYRRAPDPDLHEAHTLTLDSTKARRELGWRPQWALDESLRRVAEWYLAYQAGDDVTAMCNTQIRDHQAAR
ncbi:MAG: CDP-glucose 4,6-dehydratase [Frankiales bacterium]|nr:CDP-glucose 4,6-dehydratase [Frankiales bacterium]